MNYEVYHIPSNFTDAGRVFGLFEIRNVIETVLLAVPMLYIDLLRLLRWCRYVARDDIAALFTENTIENLLCLKLLTLHAKSGSFVLTGKGNQFLDENLDGLPAGIPPSYRKGETQRRLRVSKLTLTVYHAGVPV